MTCFLPLCLGSVSEMIAVVLKTSFSSSLPLLSSLTPWFLGWFKSLLMWEKVQEQPGSLWLRPPHWGLPGLSQDLGI